MSSNRIMHLFVNTLISTHPFKGLAETTDILVWMGDNTREGLEVFDGQSLWQTNHLRSFHSQTNGPLNALEAVDQGEWVQVALIQRSLPAPSRLRCPVVVKYLIPSCSVSLKRSHVKFPASEGRIPVVARIESKSLS